MPINRRDLLGAATASLFLAATQNNSKFSLAAFRVDVTCPLGHPLLARRQGVAKQIADPLYAHGLVLLGAGDPIVLVAVDKGVDPRVVHPIPAERGSDGEPVGRRPVQADRDREIVATDGLIDSVSVFIADLTL